VFKICDSDNDGLLSDLELANFQRRCFGMDLEAGTLDSLKSVVRKNCTEGIVRNGLSLKGFLTLHGLFIQRGRHETTWTILRKFGYGDDLSLHKDYLVPPLKIPVGSTAELSWAGYEFLTRIFEKYDQDGDGALSPQELANLFSTCPMVPWGADVYNTVVVVKSSRASKGGSRSSAGWLALPGFLGLWTLTTLLDTKKTLEHLAYMGYTFQSSENGEETQLGALNITRYDGLSSLCGRLSAVGKGADNFLLHMTVATPVVLIII
jgi:Ras family protein T1